VQNKNPQIDTIEPTISIIVPVLNGAENIKLLLDSLLELDYSKTKTEIIIVDGGSTDLTRRIVSKYPVKLLINLKKGPNAARNTGIQCSSGEIVAFTDSDCTADKNWIKKAVSNFKDPGIGCVGGDVKSLNDTYLSGYASNSLAPIIRVCKRRKELNCIGTRVGCPVGCNMIFRRKAISDAGGSFDETIQYCFEEDELIERICGAGYKVVLDPEVLIWHKHRSKLKSFLAQSFKYGRGTGKLLRKRRKQRLFRRWFVTDLLILVQTFIVFLLGAFTIFTGNWENLFLFFLTMLLIPFGILFGVYFSKALISKRKWRILFYPWVDLLRAIAFLGGVFFGFIKKL